MADLTNLADQFVTFADSECGASPLYRRLATAIASDKTLLALASSGEHEPKPNLILATVHFLLLSGIEDPLADYYPSTARALVGGDPFAHFQSFCVRHWDQIQEIIESRWVQTNEVARCAYLVPSLFLVSRRIGGRPLALVEVGASAGLLLRYDSYGYDFGNGRRIGDLAALRIDCELAGPFPHPLPPVLPTIADRIGIDLNPLDVREPADVRWLRALVWPDQSDRVERLDQAIAIARRHPITMIAGDALDILPAVLESMTNDAVPVVLHAHTLNQFSPDARQRFQDLLVAHSVDRDLYELSLEGKRAPHGQLELSVYRNGRLATEELLGQYDPHGGWLAWCDRRPG